MPGYFFGTTISYKPYNISKVMTIGAQFFLIIKNIALKKHFKIKRLDWRLVSPDCKDALNAICQTLAFLLDISLKQCLFFRDNLWRFEFKWSENFAKGCSLIFLVCQQKLYYLRFHEKASNIFYKATHSQQRRNKNQKKVFHIIPV